MGKELKGKELGKGITQRKDGRYFARYMDKYGQRKSLYSDSLRDIKKMLRDAIYEEEHGLSGNWRYVFFYTTVKTSAGKRMLPMSEEAYEVLQKLLGHASVETTMNIYTHATQDSQAIAMDQVYIMGKE